MMQAQSVAELLKKRDPGLQTEIVPIRTRADNLQNVAIMELGGKGVFVKEIETELLNGGVDIAVHSMKDVPAELPPGLEMVAYPEREDPRDVLVTRGNVKFEELRRGARIGTGSLRRRMQLLNAMPDLAIVPLRGNIMTRIKKIETDKLDGIILAAAGMRRMGWHNLVSQYLDPDLMVPAAGQGVLGIEIRADDDDLRERLLFLNHEQTVMEIKAERAFLRRLGGGCQVPIAGFARLQGRMLKMRGIVGTPDGRMLVDDTVRGGRDEAEKMGEALADSLLDKGAREILAIEYVNC